MRILIVDDSDLVRRSVAGFLSSAPDCEICGEASAGQEAVRKARELSPDVILLDVSMPDVSGLETARLLRAQAPSVKIIMMSQHDPVQMLPRALESGADACVDKCRVTTDLLATIRTLSAGTPHRIAC